MTHVSFLIDRSGVLTVSTCPAGAGGTWSDPVGVGSAGLCPGAAVVYFRTMKDVMTALTVDANGTLSAVEVDVSGSAAWLGTVGVGPPCFVPGSPLALLRLSRTAHVAVLVDGNGTLNAATANVSGATTSWKGPELIGGESLLPGSRLSAVKQHATLFSVLAVDQDGLLNVASLDSASPDGWQGPNPVGGFSLVPGSYVSV